MVRIGRRSRWNRKAILIASVDRGVRIARNMWRENNVIKGTDGRENGSDDSVISSVIWKSNIASVVNYNEVRPGETRIIIEELKGG